LTKSNLFLVINWTNLLFVVLNYQFFLIAHNVNPLLLVFNHGTLLPANTHTAFLLLEVYKCILRLALHPVLNSDIWFLEIIENVISNQLGSISTRWVLLGDLSHLLELGYTVFCPSIILHQRVVLLAPWLLRSHTSLC
jgi:hypothetical protein